MQPLEFRKSHFGNSGQERVLDVDSLQVGIWFGHDLGNVGKPATGDSNLL
jgi:hypothetical protein